MRKRALGIQAESWPALAELNDGSQSRLGADGCRGEVVGAGARTSSGRKPGGQRGPWTVEDGRRAPRGAYMVG